MEKEFISYELALRMKQLGFNENCYRVGNPNGAICWRFMDVAGVEGVGIDDILLEKFDKLWWVEIPTFSQAFRWFREKYEIEATTSCFYSKRLDIPYEERQYHCHIIRDGVTSKGPKYKTYEEAELACLEKLIEIVESKTE
jgi:hypothetical protein